MYIYGGLGQHRRNFIGSEVPPANYTPRHREEIDEHDLVREAALHYRFALVYRFWDTASSLDKQRNTAPKTDYAITEDAIEVFDDVVAVCGLTIALNAIDNQCRHLTYIKQAHSSAGQN